MYNKRDTAVDACNTAVMKVCSHFLCHEKYLPSQHERQRLTEPTSICAIAEEQRILTCQPRRIIPIGREQ